MFHGNILKRRRHTFDCSGCSAGKYLLKAVLSPTFQFQAITSPARVAEAECVALLADSKKQLMMARYHPLP